ncbi:MBL fold metallo-hydrolase [Roseimarinus sediminis]|uniref:MBL fold metallo-hydrolase n=1 Tax=Roseimarinus sediminis TaxID=1610899 RepID=UPI003D1C369F
MKAIIFSLLPLLFAGACKSTEDQIQFFPVEHASLVITAGEHTIYVDPVGDTLDYHQFNAPDLVLITHTHGDHLDKALLEKLLMPTTRIVVNQAAADQLGYGEVMKNGAQLTIDHLTIEAVAAYNTSPDRLRYHPQGEGNGYLIELAGQRIYISGDTEDIPEMRSLVNIDHAFVCMNLPYTMTPEQAASAVNEFKPAKVYPYHYRQRDGFADVDLFKRLVEATNDQSEVVLLDWY